MSTTGFSGSTIGFIYSDPNNPADNIADEFSGRPLSPYSFIVGGVEVGQITVVDSGIRVQFTSSFTFGPNATMFIADTNVNDVPKMLGIGSGSSSGFPLPAISSGGDRIIYDVAGRTVQPGYYVVLSPSFAPAPSVTLTASALTIDEVAGAAGTATITAAMSEAVNAPVTVTLAISGTASNGDFTVTPATITINANETTGSVDISAVLDQLDEPNETVVIDIDTITTNSIAVESGTQQVTVTIIDDDVTPPQPQPSPNIRGSEAADLIQNNTAGSNNIFALGGNDTIFASTGNDKVYAGDGDDQAYGGSDNDEVYGGLGNDLVGGGEGNDTVGGGVGDDNVFGGAGNDQLYGADGNDELIGDEGSDIVVAGNGNDLVVGGPGEDVAYGGEGDDIEFGGAGNDTLFGGGGADQLWGGAGDDQLWGGAGPDRFGFIAGSGSDMLMTFSQADGDRLDLQGQSYTTSKAADGDVILTLSGGGTIRLDGVTQINDNFFV